MRHFGQCHCGAIQVELRTDRPPSEQVLGACQCSFCRKHNAQAFSDPASHVTLTAREPEHLQRYCFGLKTSEQIICRRCGVYVAVTLTDGPAVWSVQHRHPERSGLVHPGAAAARLQHREPRIPHCAAKGAVDPDHARRLANIDVK